MHHHFATRAFTFAEAASDARYMHDMMRKMLHAPVFLDSSSLSDLRQLITDGVHKSDTLILLGTKGVLSRPWCLLELLETWRKGIPVIVVEMASGGFSMQDARHFVAHLEGEMKQLNPKGLELLQTMLGPNLRRGFEELRTAVTAALDANQIDPIVFDSNKGDTALVATMMDVIERISVRTKREIHWTLPEAESFKRLSRVALRKSRASQSRASQSRASKKGRHDSMDEAAPTMTDDLFARHFGARVRDIVNKGSAVFVCCSRLDAIKHARVLRSEIAIKLGQDCAIGGGQRTREWLKESRMVVVLLSRKLLTDPRALLEIWTAMEMHLPIVTVLVAGTGYDYEEASNTMTNLERAMEQAGKGSASQLLDELPDGKTVNEVGGRLNSCLTAIIAITWSLTTSKNQTDALVDQILTRMPKRKAVRNFWLHESKQSTRNDAFPRPCGMGSSDVSSTSNV